MIQKLEIEVFGADLVFTVKKIETRNNMQKYYNKYKIDYHYQK